MRMPFAPPALCAGHGPHGNEGKRVMFISTPLDKSLPSYPRRYYEQIIASINTAVLRGDLKEGDKLPSERELADLFETSRVPVREAIKVLEFCGIVEQVAGGGMIVKNIELSSLLQKLYFAIATTDDTLRELFEIRLRLESYAAERAAEARTEADLQEMKAAIESMEQDLQFRRSPFANSLRFHNAVVNASGNNVLADVYKYLYSLLNLSRTRTLSDLQHQPAALAFHKRIYGRILIRDSAGAGADMLEHMQNELNELNASATVDIARDEPLGCGGADEGQTPQC